MPRHRRDLEKGKGEPFRFSKEPDFDTKGSRPPRTFSNSQVRKEKAKNTEQAKKEEGQDEETLRSGMESTPHLGAETFNPDGPGGVEHSWEKGERENKGSTPGGSAKLEI